MSIGIEINSQLQRRANFLEHKALQTVHVGVTCERCAILNCDVRKADPIILEKRKKESDTEKVVNAIQAKYSQ